jgi:hypothetical protein
MPFGKTKRHTEEYWIFYKWAERYYTWLVAVNEHLNKWSLNRNQTEKWLLGRDNRTKQERVFRKFRQRVEVAREKLLHII